MIHLNQAENWSKNQGYLSTSAISNTKSCLYPKSDRHFDLVLFGDIPDAARLLNLQDAKGNGVLSYLIRITMGREQAPMRSGHWFIRRRQIRVQQTDNTIGGRSANHVTGRTGFYIINLILLFCKKGADSKLGCEISPILLESKEIGRWRIESLTYANDAR